MRGSFFTTNPFFSNTSIVCRVHEYGVYGSWGCSHDTTTNKMLHFLISPEKIYLKLKKDQKMKDDKNPWGYLIFFPCFMYVLPVFFQYILSFFMKNIFQVLFRLHIQTGKYSNREYFFKRKYYKKGCIKIISLNNLWYRRV